MLKRDDEAAARCLGRSRMIEHRRIQLVSIPDRPFSLRGSTDLPPDSTSNFVRRVARKRALRAAAILDLRSLGRSYSTY